MRRVLVVAAVAVAVAVSGAACSGIPVDESPRVISRERLPDALIEPTTTLPPGVDPGASGVNADLFLFLDTDNDQVLVACAVPTSADPDESDLCPNDLTNAVPSNLVVLSVRLVVERDGNVLDLNLDRASLSGIESTQQRRAIAQLVFTATDVPGVSAVRFLADGEAISVPVEDRTADPGETITTADFPELAERTKNFADFLTAVGEAAATPDTATP
jgi:hypothetical protein